MSMLANWYIKFIQLMVFFAVAVSCQTQPAKEATLCDPNLRHPSSLSCQQLFLEASPKAEFKTGRDVQDYLKVTEKEFTLDELRAMWVPLQRRRDFSRAHDDAFWASLLGYERLEGAKLSGTPPVLLFGEGDSFNWQAAIRRLRDIPVGQFQLHDALISDVNRDILTGFDRHLAFLEEKQKSKRFQYPGRIKRALNKVFALYGGSYRRRSLFDSHSLFTSMPEEQYQQALSLRETSGIRFIEMPWSRPGKRYGIIKYPSVDKAATKFAELLEDINTRMNGIKSGDSKEDPIDLAAEFQWRFVQLHPLVDGNGRTSRAIMNRILEEFGLPASSRRRINEDFSISLKEHQDLVRRGVVDSIRLVADAPLLARITPYRRGYGNRLSTKEIIGMTKGIMTEMKLTKSADLVEPQAEQIFELGGKKFTLGDDLIFTDQYGVPYILRDSHGAIEMSPLTDKTYILYALGGSLSGENFVQRDLPKETLDIIRAHANFLIRMSQDASLAKKVKILSYDNIERANESGDFQFYSWQVPLLLAVTKIKEDPSTDPMAVLVQNRGHATDKGFVGRSYLERAFFARAKTVQTTEVIGQYLLVDQFYYELRRHLEQPTEIFLKAPELQTKLLQQIDESRGKLHQAARVLLKPFIDEITKMDQADQAYLMEHPQFRLTYEYFKRTPLAFPSLAEAARFLDPRKTVVLRSASSSRVDLTGFISDEQLKNFIYAIPFLGTKFEKFVRDVNAETQLMRKSVEPMVSTSPRLTQLAASYAADNPRIQSALKGLLDYVFIDPYTTRSLDPEMGRSFVAQYLHTQFDLGPKEKLSTTANPGYLLKESPKDGGAFTAKFSSQDATIYILEVPRDGVQVDRSSGYIIQMEMGIDPLNFRQSRKAIQFKLSADDPIQNLFYLPKAPQTERTRQILQLLNETSLSSPDGRAMGAAQ